MESYPLISNPIGWAQNELLGSWRRHFMVFCLYLAASFVLSFLMYRGLRDTTPVRDFAQGAMLVFLTIQVGTLFFIGANAIRRAILRDFTSDMITSHRLSPLSGETAVFGYLTGSTAQVMVITLANWIICTVLTVFIGLGPTQSVFGPTAVLVVALCGSVLLYTLTAFVSLATRGKLTVVAVVVVLGILQTTPLIELLPGLDLLIYSFKLINVTRGAPTTMREVATLASLAFQLELALLFFLAAARKYLRDDIPAFSPILAFCLATLCSLVCAAGFQLVTRLTSPLSWSEFSTPQRQMIVSLIALALVALLPIACAANESMLWLRRRACDPFVTSRRPLPAWAAACLSTMLVLGVFLLILRQHLSVILYQAHGRAVVTPLLNVGASFLMAQLTMSGILRFAYSVMPRAVWALTLSVILLWALPPFVDLTLDVISQNELERDRSVVFTASPVGLWISVCASVEAPRVAGLAIQACLCFAALTLGACARKPTPPSERAQPTSGSITTAVP